MFNSTYDIIYLISGVLGGGILTSIFTMPYIIKKAKAEARAADIDNLNQAIASWHALADERQEELRDRNQRIDQLNQHIDQLYTTNSEWRDRYNTQQEANATLRVEIEKNRVKICQKAGCQERTPPTGY